MTGTKGVLLCYVMIVLGVAEPLSVPWVLAGSILCGALGGWASARRAGISSSQDLLTHAISMALFGSCIAMLGFWYLESPRTEWLLVALAGLCGLIGLPVFEPLTRLFTKLIEALEQSAEKWINFLVGKPPTDQDK